MNTVEKGPLPLFSTVILSHEEMIAFLNICKGPILEAGDTEKIQVLCFDRANLPSSQAFVDFMKVWSFDSREEITLKLRDFGYRFFAISNESYRSHWGAGALTLFSPSGGELVYIFVRPEERGKGHGKRLLNAIAHKILEDPSCIDKTLVLEVALSNQGALRLYQSFGMRQIAIRRGYYRSGEDALVFEKTLG